MNPPTVLSVRIKNDKEGPQTGDVVLNGSAINEWLPGNKYEVGDVVVYENQFYQSKEDQTAGTSFDHDKWNQIGIPDIIVNEFKPNTFYSKDEVVVYESKLYRAIEDFTSAESFYADDWESVSGSNYQFTSEDRTVTVTINDDTIDFSVSQYINNLRQEINSELENKVDKVAGKGLSTNDYSTEEKTKLLNLSGIFEIGDNLVLTPEGKLNAGFSVDFDASLDKNSTNGIQNKPVAEAVEELQLKDDSQDNQIQTNTANISANTNSIIRQAADIAELQSDLEADEALLNNKVDKVEGKELSSNDYTDEDQIKVNQMPSISSIGAHLSLNDGVLSADDQSTPLASETGQSTVIGMTQKAITDAIIEAATDISDLLSDVAKTGEYSDLINAPTGESLTIERNGIVVDSFDTLSGNDKTINISVPTTAEDISALPASTKYAADLALSISSTDFIITAQLKDQLGNNIGSSRTIDLPLESVVVNGEYDGTTKEVILTLENGSKIRFSIADLVNGLQKEITDYTEGAKYITGDIVIDGDLLYRANKTINSAPASLNPDDWDLIGGKPMKILTIKDAEGTTLGTYDGSADVTVTLPESFEVLTLAEIDEIWDSAGESN